MSPLKYLSNVDTERGPNSAYASLVGVANNCLDDYELVGDKITSSTSDVLLF